jgi:hypothetical protein
MDEIDQPDPALIRHLLGCPREGSFSQLFHFYLLNSSNGLLASTEPLSQS